MIRPLLLIAAIIFVFVVIHRLKRLPPEQRRSQLIKYGLIGLFLLSLLAVATGRLHWLGALLAGLATIAKFGFHTILRALPFLNILRRSAAFNNPQFNTEYLHINVDLKNGTLSGEVTDGPHKGKPLGALTDNELAELEDYYRDRDKRSYFLVRVIRQRGGHRYQDGEQYSSVNEPGIDEALQILGLEGSPTKEEIIKAHRRLMQKLHPDRGGNDYLASRVNLAKETLLKHFSER